MGFALAHNNGGITGPSWVCSTYVRVGRPVQRQFRRRRCADEEANVKAAGGGKTQHRFSVCMFFTMAFLGITEFELVFRKIHT